MGGAAPTTHDIFAILSDEITLQMLKSASTGFRARGNTAGRLKITKKQYSTRLHKLVSANLVHKRHGIYVLTALGEIVDKIILKVADDIISNYWKLKAIDSFAKKEMPKEERRKIIDSLVSDSLIKEFLS
ncbi:MAG: hypothetical protein ACE5KA_00985 [Nitrososphaerales archaeon]